MPEEIQTAFRKLLLDHPEIETISAVGPYLNARGREDQKDPGAWAFTIKLKEVQDKNGLPVKLEFRGNSLFPWSEVEVFTDNYYGQPHQRLRDGKLCLDPEEIFDADSQKLEGVYQQAIQWLGAAHKGLLAKNGDPYEFPDFNHGKRTRVDECWRLLYDEDGKGFDFVTQKGVGRRFGLADLVYSKVERKEAYLQRLRIGDDTCQFTESNWPVSVTEGSTRTVPFVVFDDIDIENHRPPIVWNELLIKIRKEIPSVEGLLKKEWQKTRGGEGLFLVGWLIPKTYGSPASQLAWRLITFATKECECGKVERGTPNCRQLRKQASSWRNSEILSGDTFVSWGNSENINQTERSVRWRLSTQLRVSKICIVGCGALGSQVAEFLVRGGCNRLMIIDSEHFEYGNLCRHTLTASSVGYSKASMLAFRLKSIIPSSDIKGYDCVLPGNGSRFDRCVRETLEGYDIVVDCTGDMNCGMWLSGLTGNCRPLRGVRAFMSGEAEFLSLCFSGKNCSLRKVETKLNEVMRLSPVWEGMDWERYKAKDELMVRGAGCWSATFPGSWININMFAGVLVNRIDAWTKESYTWEGEFSVYRCNPDVAYDCPLRLVRRETC